MESNKLKNTKTTNSNKVILMDPFPALGHINAFLNLARWLSGHGYKVVFVCSAEHNDLFQNAGFSIFNINPLILLPETYEIRTKGRLKFLLDNIYESRYKSAVKYFHPVSVSYDKLMDDVKPDLILLDDHYASKALFYNKFKVNIIMISTMTVPLKNKGIPPFQSTLVPKNNRTSLLHIDFLWTLNRLNRSVRSMVSSFLCLGNTNLKILKRLCGDSQYTMDRSRCYGIGIREIPMIATYPKSFEFAGFGSNRPVLYFGQLPEVTSEEIDDPRLWSVLNHVSNQNKTIVYCSLGTVTSNDLNVCHRFFKRLIAAAASDPRLYILLNVGKYYAINKLPSTPENVSVFTHVPQNQVLKRVDIMINHGGINSIKECLHANIPMLIYPLSLKWDQPGCAARAVYHKVGTMGNIRKDNVRTIHSKISFLTRHLNEYKDNIRCLHHKISEANQLENQKILSLMGHFANNH